MPRDDDDEYDDGYPKDDESGTEGGGQTADFRVFVGGAVTPEIVIAACRECRRRLGGRQSELGYVDYLKTILRENFEPLDFVEKMKAFEKAAGPALFPALAASPNLKWAVEDWNSDRMVRAYNIALDEAVRKMNDVVDVDLPRHTVELWLKSNVCLCGRCWKS